MFYHLNLAKPAHFDQCHKYLLNKYQVHSTPIPISNCCLIFVIEGALNVTTTDKNMALQQGQWYFNPDQKMIQKIEATAKTQFYLLTFASSSTIHQAATSFLDHHDGFDVTLPEFDFPKNTHTVETYLNKLETNLNQLAYKSTLSNDYLLSEILIELRDQFVDNLLNSPKNTPLKRTPAKFERIMQWLALHADETLEVTAIANRFDITPEYLTYLFKTYEGVSTIKFIHNLKISKAKDLLLTTNMSVKQIGYYLGFKNIKYFMRLFKKEIGYTPTDFRNNFSVSIPLPEI
ncbi:helix-turn-helix domain-containing protein [Agrilactobacillus yilanensis]|uniref:Helix-turn-helix domain-containing protein n=1 Tax=Agrilactobacillus yilanensis TaxID=2485997 RepID=A0ABW4J6T2_9LACO|nr:AraC family transcriptional regulator [Agrilactobacillus yilanensis]